MELTAIVAALKLANFSEKAQLVLFHGAQEEVSGGALRTMERMSCRKKIIEQTEQTKSKLDKIVKQQGNGEEHHFYRTNATVKSY